MWLFLSIFSIFKKLHIPCDLSDRAIYMYVCAEACVWTLKVAVDYHYCEEVF